jgi:two-component system LytT family response regulator
MPGINGFEILDGLSELKSVAPVVVFTTAFDEFAVRAFEYAAFDYLLKPIDPERLAKTLERCIAIKQSGTDQKPHLLKEVLNKLIYRNVSGIIIIDPSEVVFVEAAGNYSSFRLSDGRNETVTVSLGKVEEQLDPLYFFRTGRTFVINLRFLKKINSKKRECILHSNGKDFKCDISHDKIKILLDRLKNS